MLTPAFELRQDTEYLTVLIRAPCAKASETEIHIDDYEFKFYAKPYFLRLTLPGKVIEDGRENAKWDADSGSFTVCLPKATPGETFEGLDMLTKLLAPSGQTSAKAPLIEVLDSEVTPNSGVSDSPEDELDWQIEQEPYMEAEVSLTAPRYGFAQQRMNVLSRLQSELSDVIDLKDADNTPRQKRRELRLADEKTSFSDDHYLADLYQCDEIQVLQDYKAPWDVEYRQMLDDDMSAEDIVNITSEEKETMRNLPRKEYLLDEEIQRTTFLGLVDIIYAYAYNHRTTLGENTVESSWTICKLSGTLSWLEVYNSLQDVVDTSCRRCLCYPLYRHWKLARKVLKDTQKLFVIGRRRLLKCLLEIQGLLSGGDSRYILNDLYITDYCVWIQTASSKQLESLARNLTKIKINKSTLDLDLEELEQGARMAVSEDDASKQIANQISDLKVTENINGDMDHLANKLSACSVQSDKLAEAGSSSLHASCDSLPKSRNRSGKISKGKGNAAAGGDSSSDESEEESDVSSASDEDSEDEYDCELAESYAVDSDVPEDDDVPEIDKDDDDDEGEK